MCIYAAKRGVDTSAVWRITRQRWWKEEGQGGRHPNGGRGSTLSGCVMGCGASAIGTVKWKEDPPEAQAVLVLLRRLMRGLSKEQCAPSSAKGVPQAGSGNHLACDDGSAYLDHDGGLGLVDHTRGNNDLRQEHLLRPQGPEGVVHLSASTSRTRERDAGGVVREVATRSERQRGRERARERGGG